MKIEKCVIRSKDHEIWLLEQNGKQDGSMFWVECLILNKNGSGRHEFISQDQLREFINTSRPSTPDEIHHFLVKHSDYRFHKVMKKIPYSIFVKEW